MSEVKTEASLYGLGAELLIVSKLSLIPDEYKLYFEDIKKLLIELNKLGLLDTFNEESLELVKKIQLNYYQQVLEESKNYLELSPVEIMKYILISYNGKHCEEESETYKYLCKFEDLISLLPIILKNNKIISELLRKYNENLYNLVLFLSEIQELLKEKNNRTVTKNIIRMFGIYYFRQDNLKYDLENFKQVIIDIINNSDELVRYCIFHGVYMYPMSMSQEEINGTYQSIIDYLELKIEENKNKNRK